MYSDIKFSSPTSHNPLKESPFLQTFPGTFVAFTPCSSELLGDGLSRKQMCHTDKCNYPCLIADTPRLSALLWHCHKTHSFCSISEEVVECITEACPVMTQLEQICTLCSFGFRSHINLQPLSVPCGCCSILEHLIICSPSWHLKFLICPHDDKQISH